MKNKNLFVALMSVFISISLGCISDNTSQPYVESTPNKQNQIDYSVERVEQHDNGISIDANILIQSNVTKDEVRKLLEYFKDTEFRDYTAITIIVYNNKTSAYTPSSKFNPNDPYLVGQLNKYSRMKGELKEGVITIY